MYEIHTDGSCLNNPGPGGYGAIIIEDGNETILTGASPRTTNNRMEMTAAVKAIQHLPAGAQALLHSDSKLLTDAFNQGWVNKWQSNGWRTAKKLQVENQDLWQELLEAIQGKTITFKWVRGHAGNLYNERCDKLANEAAKLAQKANTAEDQPDQPTPQTEPAREAAPTADYAVHLPEDHSQTNPNEMTEQLAANLRGIFSKELAMTQSIDESLEVRLPVLDSNHRPLTVCIIPDMENKQRHLVTDGNRTFQNNSVLPQEVLESASWQKMMLLVTATHGVTIEANQTLTFQVFFDDELAKAVFQMAQAITAVETLRNTALTCREIFR